MNVPRVLNKGQLNELLSEAKRQVAVAKSEHQKFNAVRNLGITSLLISSAIRNQELVNLNIECFEPENKRFKIRKGKNGNNDYQPLTNQETWQHLENYLQWREKLRIKHREAFFLSWRGERVNTNAVRRIVKKIAVDAGLGEWIHPHVIRHSIASFVLDRTSNIMLVSRMLRHKDLSSTQVYLHISKNDIAKVLVEIGI